jgi:type IV secretory pathway VirB3-like protein
MPISGSSSVVPIPNYTVPSTGTELPTFNFIAGWVLMITILVFISKNRFGYVIIYYSLLLMIIIILVTEYQQIAPLLANIQTIGQFNTSSSSTQSTTTNV